YAMAGTVWPEGGRKSFNRIYVAQNVGVAIGAALGGFAAQYSFTVVFAANSLLTLSFFLLALFAYRGLTGQRYTGDIAAQNVTEVTEPLADKKKLAALSLLCAAFFLCWVAYVQWQSTISAYTQSIGIG
ncbi:MFS transporter, partial [Staphylococcus aureus]|nr:MFS transporter [Staphylococcus aureus]